MSELLEEHDDVDVESRITSADPERLMTAGSSILFSAMFFCGKEAVNILLDHGADPLARDAGGFTPIMAAVMNDNASSLGAALWV